MTVNNLPEILRLHDYWVRGEEGGERADLRLADLHGADLHGANLRGAHLHGANLRGACLHGANLRGAILHGANLHGADLRRADLRRAYLHCAILNCTKLQGANLQGAALNGANLTSANLIFANLHGASLNFANLSCAFLDDVDFSGVTSLWNVIGNMREVKSLQCDGWPVTYTANLMQIGCQKHDLNDWWTLSDSEISDMADGALTWWRKWKPILKTIIEASPADAAQAPQPVGADD